ncbi:MAG: Nramp family divalent metal transporter [Nitrospirae bacterium]|nr:Nramp family divalent metal transporter [Nitrospirota bacterium]
MTEASRKSLEEVYESVDTTAHHNFWKRLFAFFGPAYLVSVGYMDPGNWATDIAGGSQFGYTLIWVLLMSNLMALLLQSLSARLGLAGARDLAQASKETYPSPVNFFLWILAEIAIAATDLAEVLGMAIGLKLLFGLPMIIGVCITVLDTFLFLILQGYGMRKMEVFILGMISIIGMAFCAEIFFSSPKLTEIASGFVPHIPDASALYIAIGIIGATVMPHNLYLHSALVQTRKIRQDEESIRSGLKYNLVDTSIALNIAFLVNASILILAAAAFHQHGFYKVAGIEDAHHLLKDVLGTALAPILFAIALIASGQSSTVTGTLAGQIVMEGYLNLRIRPWLRRLITRLLAIIPAFLTIIFLGEGKVGELLVLSQVILSLQLGFAVIPLIHFVSDENKMGKFAINDWVKSAAWISAGIIITLNVKLVMDTLGGWFGNAGDYVWLYQMTLLPVCLAVAALLVYIAIYPFVKRRKEFRMPVPHQYAQVLGDVTKSGYKRIAVALDFSEMDSRTIAHALPQGETDAKFLLIHIVETAGSRMLGSEIMDYETAADEENLKTYASRLVERGYQMEYRLGYGEPIKAIPAIVKEFEADLLVMGAHGHRGLKDLIFGETVYKVRHRVNIPVLIVS